jgi:peptidoglycan/xylan/chitin deacetylase (PgdA/CDA1 family)
VEPSVCLTLDLEADYGGRLDPTYAAWNEAGVDRLLELLGGFGARLTVFAVGESLTARPAVIERFLKAGAEFHLHSHTHSLSAPDSLEEIQRGAAAFAEVLGRRPRGYRAPEGRISPAGWARLEAEGFEFDSSVFPSFWPAPRYVLYRPRPFRPKGRRLWELPISTLSPLRFIVSLSFMKLLGWGFYETLLENASWPEPLVFDMHLHDVFAPESYARLGGVWRTIYRHHRHDGMAILTSFLGLLSRRNARFRTLGAIASELAPGLATGDCRAVAP